jgi:hypothetical protein
MQAESKEAMMSQGNELGDVERVLEGPGGKQYIVIGGGGFLRIGEKHVPIPLERVAVRGDRLVTRGLNEDQIRSMQTWIGTTAVPRTRS